MKINSARQAWHDCKYNPAPGQTSDVVQLGVVVQNTERGPTASHAVHGALAGHIQSAIARLHPQIRVFGDFMYAAEQSDDIREAAEEVVFLMMAGKSPRMTAAKREKLEYVVKGVMRRYRHMHQGGQSSNEDPLANAEKFRAWIMQFYGVRLESCAWSREWEPHIARCFECCEDLDRMALSPIAAAIYQMKDAA
ncbi:MULTISPECIES: hypothetical protein [Pseudomonas fluorescens group]|uniref:Prophage PssSM-02 n=1 Tax=Pseudomonas azotoformans TaxID=47878 RepID=A0A4Q0I1K9_PSEAZ|nr:MULTISPECIES: hypothetical protein [Pseudomonas fluorescens group]RXE54189.1 hypothetical protein B4O85_04925 [Pseudomonas azotoformans]